MIKIGITGGIGSGKSYVSHLLEKAGIPVYDTDTEAKKLTLSHPRIREGLLTLLGEEVYKADGSLNKPVLANYLFASAENAGRVNRIIHPCVHDLKQSVYRVVQKPELQLYDNLINCI